MSAVIAPEPSPGLVKPDEPCLRVRFRRGKLPGMCGLAPLQVRPRDGLARGEQSGERAVRLSALFTSAMRSARTAIDMSHFGFDLLDSARRVGGGGQRLNARFHFLVGLRRLGVAASRPGTGTWTLAARRTSTRRRRASLPSARHSRLQALAWRIRPRESCPGHVSAGRRTPSRGAHVPARSSGNNVGSCHAAALTVVRRWAKVRRVNARSFMLDKLPPRIPSTAAWSGF